jgi:precorrin-4 methylase
VSTGKVTFVSLMPGTSGSLSWRATWAIAEADFVIWTGGTVIPDVLRHAPVHADVFLDSTGTSHSLLPFYDLASRDGFRIAQISSDIPARREEVVEQLDLCAELGLITEIVRP